MKHIPFIFLTILLFQSCKDSTNPVEPEKEGNYQMVFTSDRDSDGLIKIEMGSRCEVYSMNIDGSNQTRLTNNDNYDFSPKYSFDGSRIVYTSAEDWLMSNIFIMNEDGTNAINLGSGEHPKFSNDNSKILYKTRGLIGIIDTDGGHQVVLTNWADSIRSTAGQDYPVQFSSDDSKILFLSRKDNNNDIYTMSIDGTNIQRLTSDPGYDGDCSFSNDDTKILFTSYRTGVGQIYIMNGDGSNKKQLTTTEAFNNNARFSPNGIEMAFISFRDGQTEIYRMNIDRTNQRRLTHSNSIKANLSFSPDGQFLVFQQKEKENMNEKKWDIYLLNIEGGEIVNLTNGAGNNFEPAFNPVIK